MSEAQDAVKKFMATQAKLSKFVRANKDVLDEFHLLITQLHEDRAIAKELIKTKCPPGTSIGEFSSTECGQTESYTVSKLPPEILSAPGVIASVNSKTITSLLATPRYAALAPAVARARTTSTALPSVRSPKVPDPKDIEAVLK